MQKEQCNLITNVQLVSLILTARYQCTLGFLSVRKGKERLVCIFVYTVISLCFGFQTELDKYAS